MTADVETAPSGGRVSTAEFYQALMNLRTEVYQKIDNVEQSLVDMERRLLARLEQGTPHTAGGCEKVIDHELRLREIERLVTTMNATQRTTNKILYFVASIFAAYILGLLWSLFTGQAILTFLP
jgi:hypothetical protein